VATTILVRQRKFSICNPCTEQKTAAALPEERLINFAGFVDGLVAFLVKQGTVSIYLVDGVAPKHSTWSAALCIDYINVTDNLEISDQRRRFSSKRRQRLPPCLP